MRRAAGGYVLLPVAIAIALIGLIAYLAATESAMETRLSSAEQDKTRAEYVAQAGLQHALRDISQQGCGPYTGLGNIAFAADRYTASLNANLGNTARYRIAVAADSWIRSDQPTATRADDLKLHTRNEAAGIERPLLRYDLSPIPPGSPILSATAWFYVTNDHAEGPVDIHLTQADWSEDDATWESMNMYMDSAVLASIRSQPDNGVWVSVNLTAPVQAWVNGQANYGITLNSEVDGVHGQYNSRESDNPPYLEVVTGSTTTALAQLQAKGQLANGIGHSISRTISLRQWPASFSELRLDTGAGADAMLSSFFSDRNYGDNELQVEAGGAQLKHTLLRFDLSAIPPGASILSAQLKLHHHFSSGIQVTPTVDVYRMTREWVEGTSTGVGSADGATWNTRDGTSDWTEIGGDHASVAAASSLVSDAVDDWESWEIGELLQGWLEGRYPNYGVILKGSGEIDINFISKEDPETALHPRLSIEYSCACDQVCAIPQGRGRVLLAVANPVTLVQDDAYKKALFESWGFIVTVIGESADQASYDSAMATADLVYLSETVSASEVGDRLVNATIGVVIEDGGYNPDFGLAAGAAWPIASSIDITNSEHYITAPFATGELVIYSAPMEQLSVSGSAAAGLLPLADSAGSSSLAVLDAAAALSGGGIAAGRRVMLPLGRSGLFNWEQLNGNGRLLLQRAITWAAGLDQIAEGLLLVVANPASLSAGEAARKTLFESWGYQVELIDDSDTLTRFSAAVASNDIAYVAVEVDAIELGDKLAGVEIGVVNEEAEQIDDLRIAEAALYRDRSQIDIVDNSHYITEPFLTGLLSVVDSAQPVHMLGVNTAPGLMTLAQSFDAGLNWRPSLAAIELGGQLRGGSLAPGRRVQLPWGGEGFAFDELNNNGRNLLRRALKWVASSAGGGPPIAHWRLDESSATTAMDSVATNDGSLVNGPVWAEGLVLGGLDFDAANDSVDIGPAPDLDDLFSGGATLTGWIYARGWGEAGSGRIADKSDSTALGSGWQLSLDSGAAALRFESGFSSSRGSWSTPPGSISLDRWHHVALVYNGSSASNAAALYIDGLAQNLIVDSNPAGTLTTDAAFDLTLGNHAADATRTFDGRLDDLRLYDRMLSAGQVAELAQFPGPVAHWLLDEGSGLNAMDLVGGNHGSLVDGPGWSSAVFAGGLEFDGVDDLVNAGNFDVVGSGLTMMGWFRADTLGSNEPRIISSARGSGAADAWWQLGVTDAGADRYLQMRIKAGGVTTTFTDASSKLATEEWYFAVATYDSLSGRMRLFLDGAEIASGNHAAGGVVDAAPGAIVAIGANAAASGFFDGVIDDPRVYDYALTAAQIKVIFDSAEVPDDIAYRERFQTWKASSDRRWETMDLSTFGVPGGVVAEIAILNSKDNAEREGGLRAVGSSLDRVMDLGEVESGGFDTVTMHVQVDANSQIEHYAEKKKEIEFVLLGYWGGVSYSEGYSSFSSAADNVWTVQDLSGYGVGANQVVEIALLNDSASAEHAAGLRAAGSGLQRSVILKEAESGGIDAVSMMVNSGPAASVEVFAESSGNIEFYLLGHWTAAPGVYTELGSTTGQAGVGASWQPVDLGSFGIPADAVAQLILKNESDSRESQMGVRETGSSEARLIELQEAESGGSDATSLHVGVDADGRIEWYAETGAAEQVFQPVGWWLLTP